MPPDAPYTPSGLSVPRVTANMKESLLKFIPQISYFQFDSKLELKFTPQLKLSLIVDDVYMCSMRAHLKQLAE